MGDKSRVPSKGNGEKFNRRRLYFHTYIVDKASGSSLENQKNAKGTETIP